MRSWFFRNKLLVCGVIVALVGGGIVAMHFAALPARYTGPSATEQGGAPNAGERPAPCVSAPPVNCASGALWLSYTDFTLPEPGAPLEFDRTYTSVDSGTRSLFGYGWTSSYTMSLVAHDGLVTITQEDGATVTFTQHGSGYAAPDRVLASLTRDAHDYVYTRFGDNRRTFAFDPTGRLVAERDTAGETVYLTYPRGSVMITENNRSLTLTITDGHVTAVCDRMGRTERYGYDKAGDLRTVIDDAGDEWSFQYDAHRLTTYVDQRGQTTSISYYPDGRVHTERVTGPTQPTALTAWSYNAAPYSMAASTTTMIGPNGSVTRYDFTNLELTSVTVADSTPYAATTTYTYPDDRGLPDTVTDPNHDTTDYRYNPHGQVQSRTDAMHHRTTYSYNPLDELTTVIQPGSTTPSSAATFDPVTGARRTTTDGNGHTTHYKTDPQHPDEITRITDPLTHTLTQIFDADGDLTSSTDADQHTTAYAYDADGELVCQQSADFTTPHQTTCRHGSPNTTEYWYDEIGRQRQTAEYAAAGATPNVTTTRYPDPLTTVVTDQDRNVTTRRLDSRGEVTTTERTGTGDVTGTITDTYNPDGTLHSSAESPTSVTTYGYDPLGRVAGIADPDHRTTTYAYDGDDNLVRVTDPAQHATNHQYNSANELVEVSYSDDRTPTVRYQYQPDGLRKSMSDGTGTTNYTYDGDGQPTKVASPTGTVGYAYDSAERQNSVTYPGGQIVNRLYDDADRLIRVIDWQNHTTSFGYTNSGTLDETRYPNGVTVRQSGAGVIMSHGYDTQHPIAALSYASRNGDQQVTRTDYYLGAANGAPQAQGTDQFNYNALGELARFNGANYGYDALGDLTTLAGRGGQQFDVAGQLQPGQLNANTPTVPYEYNPEGDRIRTGAPGGSASLTYDQAGELTAYDSTATSASYRYDGDGVRTEKTVGATSTVYTWDITATTPALLVAGTTRYVYGPNGQPVEEITDGTPTYLQTDDQHSVRVLTNAGGSVVGTYMYSPYGQATAHTGTATSALQFDGQYVDAETGFQYLRARYYDPATAEFLTPDPDVASTGEPYGFAADDPVDRVDPTGLFSWGDFWAVIGVVGLIAVTILADGADLPILAGAGAESTVDTADAATLTEEGGEDLGAALSTGNPSCPSGCVPGESGGPMPSSTSLWQKVLRYGFAGLDLYQGVTALPPAIQDCFGHGQGSCSSDALNVIGGIGGGTELLGDRALAKLVAKLRTTRTPPA